MINSYESGAENNPLKVLNQKIAGKIADLINPYLPVESQPVDRWVFRHPKVIDDWVALERSNEPSVRTSRDEFGYDFLPKNFKFPVFRVEINGNDRMSTPYGIFPRKVRTPSDRIILFDQFYFFNHQGQAFKALFLTQSEDSYDYENNRLRALSSIDFEPDEFDQNTVPLKEEDYEVIEARLHQVEQGIYLLKR